MGSDEHLKPWRRDEHKTHPKETGCVWGHVRRYELKKHPRCSYRKNAHDYSKVHEKLIYNVPNIRSPQRWVEVWVERLAFSFAKTGKPIAGTKPVPPHDGAWDLGRGRNFEHWKIPYWHNTHHCVACGEILDAFDDKEVQLLLATRWNINEMPNVVILPKQYAVARVLKLPTHVPPNGAQNHNAYSATLGIGLEEVKTALARNADTPEKHELTDKTAPDCAKALTDVSQQLRTLLIDAGKKNPGINLDNLRLERINWTSSLGS